MQPMRLPRSLAGKGASLSPRMPNPSAILKEMVQSFGGRMRFHRRDAETYPGDRSYSGSAGRAVILPFGRYFAACADLLTREGLKTVALIDGVSPSTAVDDPDPDMLRFAEGARATDRSPRDRRGHAGPHARQAAYGDRSRFPRDRLRRA